MNNFLERIPSNLVNNSHHISQNLTAIRKSRTLMPNEDKASFLSNKRCSNNKQDKRGRRFVSFIEHFKKRSKSADQSNKQSFSQSAKSGDNLVGNESSTSKCQPVITSTFITDTNLHIINHKNQFNSCPVQNHINSPATYDIYPDTVMSTSVYESTHRMESQLNCKPRPASFHPSSQILTHHNPHLYQNSIFSSTLNKETVSPYTYCNIDNLHYMESNQQNEIHNMIMYDSVFDYPPTLSPYPCPTYIPPSDDVTPTNENVNPYPSNCRSRNRPTSVDFHRIRKMHTSMKQFFTFNHYNNNSSRKDDLSQKSINNKVQVKENSVVNPSFFDSSYNNSNLNSPIVNTNNSSNRISLNCSNNTNFKGTILRSFSCTPKSNYESKKKFKSQTLKSQNISIDVTTTCNTNTTTCSSGLSSCDYRRKTLDSDPGLHETETQSRLLLHPSKDKPVNGSSIVSRNSLKTNSKFDMVKSSSVCQVTTCHNMPKLSAKTVQSENNAPVSSTDCKLTDNTLTRANTLSTVGITNTISNSTTTSDDMIKKFESTDITTPTRTSHPGSVMKNNDPNFNITNSNNNNNSSFYSVPHNIPMNGNTTSSDLPERQRLKKLRNSRLMSNFNSTTDDSNHMRINKFMQTTSLLDYLSNDVNNSAFSTLKNNTTSRSDTGSTLPSNIQTTVNHLSSVSDSKPPNDSNRLSMVNSDNVNSVPGGTQLANELSTNTFCTQNHTEQKTVSKACPELLCNLPELHCARLSKAHSVLGYESVRHDIFSKSDDNKDYCNSNNAYPSLRNSRRRESARIHPHYQSVQCSAAVLRPPRPPQRTTSLVRDNQSVRSNSIISSDASYSSHSSPNRNPTCSKQESNNQILSTSLYGTSNQNRYSYIKPLDNMSIAADKLTDKEVSDLDSENDTVWWSHLLPYKPSNLPSNLADRLRQRNSLILSRSSPTARLSNSSLPTSFPYNCSNQINNSNNNNNGNGNKVAYNIPNLMIQSMYEQSDSSGSSGLRTDGLSSLYYTRNKGVSDSRIRHSRPLSVHTDYSHSANNSFHLPSLTHLNSTINTDTVHYSSSSSSASSQQRQHQQQQQQQRPSQQISTRPSSLSLGLSFKNVTPKATSFVAAAATTTTPTPTITSTRTNKLYESHNSSAYLPQTNIFNSIPDYLLTPYPPSDSPLLGQYCRLLLLRTNDGIQRNNISINNNADNNSNGININNMNNKNVSPPIEHSSKLTPTAETPATPV
uniref:Uncharacterized protein n=1 Tax=Trichobilharzia regenti TaxID=157069 RepID=A0AA85JDG0_TRIRE|nr:unnamed protein product [Trichobilharzia regenti]